MIGHGGIFLVVQEKLLWLKQTLTQVLYICSLIYFKGLYERKRESLSGNERRDR